MRAAPAVSVRCTGGWRWRLLQVALPGWAAGVATAWAGLHAELPGPSLALLTALCSLAVLWLAWHLTRPRACELRWDGQQWTADGCAGRLQLMLDLGPWMLIRWRGEARAVRWLAASASEAGAHWHALRAAVYSRPPDTPASAVRPEPTAD